MSIHFATDPDVGPNKQFASRIPPGERSPHVRNAVWTTNYTREGAPTVEWPYGVETPARFATCLAKADEADSVCFVDGELYNISLASFLYTPELFDANLKRHVKILQWTRDARYDVRIGLYPGEAWVGLNPGQYNKSQRADHLKTVRAALDGLTDVNLIEAWLPNLGKYHKSMAAWEHDLDERLEETDGRDTYVMIGDVYADNSGYVGDRHYLDLFTSLEEKKVKRMVWNAAPHGWKVVAALAAKS